MAAELALDPPSMAPTVEAAVLNTPPVSLLTWLSVSPGEASVELLLSAGVSAVPNAAAAEELVATRLFADPDTTCFGPMAT